MNEERMLKWFEYDKAAELVRVLKLEEAQDISRLFHSLANIIADRVKPGPERTVALRKLLESKDAVVRATVHPGG